MSFIITIVNFANLCGFAPICVLCIISAEKILAIQFKYFGDAVLFTPALRALRKQLPDCELHLLVPEELAPLFQHLSWLNRVWPMPRRRGSASLRRNLASHPRPAPRALRPFRGLRQQ